MELRTSDGIRISGWLRRRDGSAPVCLIACHGYRGSSLQSLPWFQLAERLGCSCLAFDFRAHDHSGGGFTTCGAKEILDLAAAVDYVSSEPRRLGRIVVCGLSMGASTGIRLAAQDPRIKAVIAESPYLTLEHATHAWCRATAGPFGPLLSEAMCRAAKARWNVEPAEVSPMRAAAALVDTPLLVLAAGRDKLAPPESVRKIAEAAPLGQLVVLKRAMHAACWATDGATVATVAEAFIRRVTTPMQVAPKPDI
ncbi:MAG: alpha/beta fold hydrolase [Armatimonadetes bacterium]|nr:alpha/beta fold hydrolase [Armatimonadota bacterium]MDE2207025.1 alpha/beta fold hydrolase [Armatimonadota bacterium]